MQHADGAARAKQSLRTVGLFAGIGGLEEGLRRAGHETKLLCEIDEAAQAVLRKRFRAVPLHDDVCTLEKLPRGTDLLTAGFPCQDLSQAGKTLGIWGRRSGLVAEVFRLVEDAQPKWLLLENVPFMLRLDGGRAMEVIVRAVSDLGYRWAYRVVDSRAFGVPQRRERVLFVASRVADPRTVLFADEAGVPSEPVSPLGRLACGFYWTEGNRGKGWAVDAIPTLKGGSSFGIPSPPAIVLPTREVVTPDIRDAERLQGFRENWTKPAETVGRASYRWKLIGNAVTVPVARWLGERLSSPSPRGLIEGTALKHGTPWPRAAWGVGHERYAVQRSSFPKQLRRLPLDRWLRYDGAPLSAKATAGFVQRAEKSGLIFEPGFLELLREHLRLQQSASAA